MNLRKCNIALLCLHVYSSYAHSQELIKSLWEYYCLLRERVSSHCVKQRENQTGKRDFMSLIFGHYSQCLWSVRWFSPLWLSILLETSAVNHAGWVWVSMSDRQCTHRVFFFKKHRWMSLVWFHHDFHLHWVSVQFSRPGVRSEEGWGLARRAEYSLCAR